MNLLPLLFDLSAQLDFVLRARGAKDTGSERAHLRRATCLIIEYARRRMMEREPHPMVRALIKAAAGRVMGRPAVQSRATGDPGASGAAKKGRKRRKATGRAKKARGGRPVQAKVAGHA